MLQHCCSILWPDARFAAQQGAASRSEPIRSRVAGAALVLCQAFDIKPNFKMLRRTICTFLRRFAAAWLDRQADCNAHQPQ
jgi:hypothetical protein